MIDTSNKSTEEVLKIAEEYADEHNIDNIVVATTRGKTGRMVGEIFNNKNVVAVTHSTGFKDEGEQELKENNRKKMEEQGELPSHIAASVLEESGYREYLERQADPESISRLENAGND